MPSRADDYLDAKIARAIVGPPGRGRTANLPQTPAALTTRVLNTFRLDPTDKHSTTRAAEALGVDPSTFRRWRRTTDKHLSATMRATFRRSQLSPKREAELRARGNQKSGNGSPVVRLKVVVSNEIAQNAQNAYIGRVLKNDHARNVNDELIDAYLTGVPGAMTAAFNSILDTYSGGVGMETGELLSIDMED
jgi:transposase-like protein